MHENVKKKEWPRPSVIPLPDETYGCADIDIDLLKEPWQMNLTPEPEFWKTEIKQSD